MLSGCCLRERTYDRKEKQNEKFNPHVNWNTDVVEAVRSGERLVLFNPELENKHLYNVFTTLDIS